MISYTAASRNFKNKYKYYTTGWVLYNIAALLDLEPSTRRIYRYWYRDGSSLIPSFCFPIEDVIQNFPGRPQVVPEPSWDICRTAIEGGNTKSFKVKKKKRDVAGKKKKREGDFTIVRWIGPTCRRCWDKNASSLLTSLSWLPVLLYVIPNDLWMHASLISIQGQDPSAKGTPLFNR